MDGTTTMLHRLKWIVVLLMLAIYGTMGFLMLPWFLAAPLTLVMILTTRRPKKREPKQVDLSGISI